MLTRALFVLPQTTEFQTLMYTNVSTADQHMLDTPLVTPDYLHSYYGVPSGPAKGAEAVSQGLQRCGVFHAQLTSCPLTFTCTSTHCCSCG